MKTDTYFHKKLETTFWALLLIWWGLRWSVLVSLPEGSGLVGTGILLFGATAALRLAGLQADPNNVFFGLIALLSGGALITLSLMHISAELPVLETIMIVLGIVLLGYALIGKKKQASNEA